VRTRHRETAKDKLIAVQVRVMEVLRREKKIIFRLL